MKTVAIIQARLGSSRLPGKVTLDLGGQPALTRVINRIRRCEEIDQVVVATSSGTIDNPIVDLCIKLNVPVFRGSEDDVLDRFYQAAKQYDADICVRVTADCPLIDPTVSDDIIRKYKNAVPAIDYASNKIPQSFPRGLDTEVFSFTALERAWQLARQDYERAHVTIYLYEHPEIFSLLSITSEIDRADWRWTLDTEEDYQFLKKVYQELGPGDDFSWTDVLSLLERHPEFAKINAHVQQKAVHAG